MLKIRNNINLYLDCKSKLLSNKKAQPVLKNQLDQIKSQTIGLNKI
jgi:hypothetical protein